MRALTGLIVGIFLGYTSPILVDEKICAVIIFAAIDSVCGGFVAKLNSSFSDAILFGGFITGVTFAVILVLLGNFFNLEAYYIALIIFGLRIFKNLMVMQKIFLKKYGT